MDNPEKEPTPQEGSPAPEKTPVAPQDGAKDSSVLDAERVENLEGTLKKAEFTIEKLRKELSGKTNTVDPVDIDEIVKEKVDEILREKLPEQIKSQTDSILEELKRSKEDANELKLSLLAKASAKGAGAGVNEDKPEPVKTTPLTAMDEQLIARAAARESLSIIDYKKKHGFIT